MKDNEMYYGITIGPIVKTLCMTSTPGGLWLASYIFSYIAKQLIVEIKRNNGDVLIPSFEEKDSEEVGSYPDHIIFIADNDLDMNKIIKDTKEKLRDLLYRTFIRIDGNQFLTRSFDKNEVEKFVNEYINIHCIKIKNVNNIMNEISEILDNVEQFNSYVYEEKENYFLTLFNGIKIKESDKVDDKDRTDAKNIYIKKFFKILNEDKENNTQVKPQVIYKNTIKTVDDIAVIENKKDYKISNYLAIVQADGDGMTKLFNDMGNDIKEVKEFSKSCVDYTTKSADLIKEYGGVTIYAGGDDLLFLAPIISKNNDENILDLCEKIRQKFEKLEHKGASISFGIAINYKKFPLYESFNQARKMLYEAKKLGDNKKKKDSIAINLTKASGLSVFLNFGNETETLKEFKNFINKYYISNEKSKQIKDSTNSVIYLIDNYRDLYDIAANNKNEKEIENFFINMYSNPMQENYQEFIKDITNLFIKIKSDKENKRFKSIIENDSYKDKNTELSSILRFAKFLVEKRGQGQ